MKISHASPSRLEVFDQCPYQYRLKYHEGIPVVVEHPAAQFGSWLHEVFEIHVKDGIPLKDAMKKTISEYHVQNSYLDKVPGILRNFNKVNHNLPKGQTEFEFKLDIGIGVPVNGIIDRLIQMPQGVLILDYKTGTWQKTAKQLKTNYQMQIYACASHHITKVPYSQIQLALLYLQSGDLVKVQFEDGEIDQFHGQLKEKIHTIQTMEPEQAKAKPSGACKLCPYTSECKTYQAYNRLKGGF